MITTAVLVLSTIAHAGGAGPTVALRQAAQAAPGVRQSGGGQPATPAARKPAATAEAYYVFLEARQHELDGDIEAAIKLYREAARLDPGSGAILAELAGLYARQNQLREAIDTAETALKIDKDTVEAHAILGSIYAAYAQSEESSRAAASKAAGTDYASRAIAHFEAVLSARGATADPDLLLTLGRLYLRTSAPEKAIPVLARFNEQEPDAMEGIALLADAYTQSGRSEDAIKLLSRSAERESSFYPLLASLYERAGRWSDAADTYQKGAQRGTTSPEVTRRWSSALLNARRPGDAARARDLLRQLLKNSPNDTRALYLLAQAQRDLNDFPGAEATARRLIAADPRGTSGPYALAQVYEQQHDYRKVADTLQPLVDRLGETTPVDIELIPVLLHLGFAYLDLAQPEHAIRVLQRAKQGAADDPTIDVGLVQAEISAKRYSQAIDLAQKARARHPSDVRLVRLEADALRQNGQLDRGVSLLQEVQQAHPEDASNYLALAELLMTGDRAAQAESVLREAQAKFPQDVAVLFDLGAVYERQKRYDAAEAAFKQVLARDPLHAQALNYLGYMLADRGVRLQESVDYIRRALAVEPNNPAYLDSIGWAYFKMSRFDLAEPNLRRAAADRPNDSAVQDHWGDLLLKLGRRDEAISAWRRALTGDGQDIDRATIEGKIRSAGAAVKK